VSCNLNHPVLRLRRVLVRAITETLEVVQTYRDHAASLRVLNFKVCLIKTVLEPVIAIKLADQVTLGVGECKLLCVSREIDFRDVKLELLFLFCLF